MDNYLKSREDYIDYKYFDKSIVLADKTVSDLILLYLERLGFSMNYRRIYNYKDLIMICDRLKIIDQYDDKTCLELISYLRDSESDLYRRFSLKLEISLECLNLLINDVVSEINYDVMDDGLLNQVCSEYSY